MSRIGKHPVTIPAGVTVTIAPDAVTVKGPKGELTQQIKEVTVKQEGDQVIVVRPENNDKLAHSLYGTYRALIANMVQGVSEGFAKQLELVGVGYRATNQGQKLDLSLGFSHNVVIELPAEIKVETVSEKGQNPVIKLYSHDKELLGKVCAKIRSLRKPEPYKGKGIKFVGEIIRRKAGKSA